MGGPTILTELEGRALALARAAQANAHAPYSQKQVGAAVITARGTIFAGCNVENEREALRVCAERNAVAAAVAAGERDLVTVTVVAPDNRFWPPCASCREVLAELAPDAEIVMCTRGGRVHRGHLDTLPERPFAAT